MVLEFWEFIIGLTKQAVKKTLGRKFISLKQLNSVVTQVEYMNRSEATNTITPFAW